MCYSSVVPAFFFADKTTRQSPPHLLLSIHNRTHPTPMHPGTGLLLLLSLNTPAAKGPLFVICAGGNTRMRMTKKTGRWPQKKRL